MNEEVESDGGKRWSEMGEMEMEEEERRKRRRGGYESSFLIMLDSVGGTCVFVRLFVC